MVITLFYFPIKLIRIFKKLIVLTLIFSNQIMCMRNIYKFNKTNPGVLYRLCENTTSFELKFHHKIIEQRYRNNMRLNIKFYYVRL